MKQSNRDAKEKEVRAWLQEQEELYSKRRKKEVIELSKPIFRGYILSFQLTPKGEKELSDKRKKLFYSEKLQFFIRDKIKAKETEPNTDDPYFGDFYRDPDWDYNIGYFWPLVVRTRNGEIPEKHKGKIYGYNLKWDFKLIDQRDLFNGDKLDIYALRIPLDFFSVKVKKYKQKRAWVEDSYIDSRLEYLRKKLYIEKNWMKYGPDKDSYSQKVGRQPKGLYHSKLRGISPSHPYKRSAQKEQSKTLIKKHIDKNGNNEPI